MQEMRALSKRLTLGSALCCLLAGVATLMGWRLQWSLFLPKLPGAIPMPPDTAVAFLLVALNLFLLWRGRAASCRIVLGYFLIAGGLTRCFLESTNVPCCLSQAFFEQFGIYVHSRYPCMLLAASVGFILWGFSLICLTKLQNRFSLGRAVLAAVCGTLLITLALLCLLSHFLGIQNQESGLWSHWIFRMATETAVLFLLLGATLCQTIWTEAQRHLGKDRPRITLAAGLLTSAGLLLMFWVVNINLSLGLHESLRLRSEIARYFGAIKNISELVAAVREIESGQRGFLLTHDEKYLESYHSGLRQFNKAKTQQKTRGKLGLYPELDRLMSAKLSELKESVRLAHSGRHQAAMDLVKTGHGFDLMTEIEHEAAHRSAFLEQFIIRHTGEYQNTINMVMRTIMTSYGLALALLLCAVHLFSKEIRRRADVEETLRIHETELETRIAERTAELQASESRYRAILEQAPFAVHVLDRQGNSVGINPQFEQFFGISPTQMQGYNIWADPQPVRQGTVELLKRAFAGEAGFSGVIRHEPILSEGTALAQSCSEPKLVEVYAYPVKALTSEVQEVVLFCKDVTAREEALKAVRESELKFRQLTNALPLIVWTAQPDGVVDYFNDRWYEFTGFTPGPDHTWECALHPDDVGDCWEKWRHSLQSGEPHIFEQRLWDRSRGQYRWHVAWGVPVRGATGEIGRWVGSLTDIHASKETEQILEERVHLRTAELEKSYKLLQTKEEALRHSLAERDTLFREVHHRVKNNLQVISSLLRMHGQSLGNQPVAAMALEEARRRVLSMAMIHERLYAHQHMDRIDFGEYTQTLTYELTRFFALPDKKIETRINTEKIELDVEQAIPCGLILNELITNALKYAFPERPSGLITVTLAQADSGYINLAVADNGIGLPEGFNWKKSKSMGLPIVDILARQLEGHAEVESRAGLRVTIRFPHRVLAERAA